MSGTITPFGTNPVGTQRTASSPHAATTIAQPTESYTPGSAPVAAPPPSPEDKKRSRLTKIIGAGVLVAAAVTTGVMFGPSGFAPQHIQPQGTTQSQPATPRPAAQTPAPVNQTPAPVQNTPAPVVVAPPVVTPAPVVTPSAQDKQLTQQTQTVREIAQENTQLMQAFLQGRVANAPPLTSAVAGDRFDTLMNFLQQDQSNNPNMTNVEKQQSAAARVYLQNVTTRATAAWNAQGQRAPLRSYIGATILQDGQREMAASGTCSQPTLYVAAYQLGAAMQAGR